MGRQVNGSASGGRLGCGDEPLAGNGDSGLLDGDGAVDEVEVAAAQGGEFAEAEAAPCGQQHDEPVTWRHRVGERPHLGDGEQRDVLRRGASGGALDGDGGLVDESAGDRCAENRLQQ